jgi:hypothetical protein
VSDIRKRIKAPAPDGWQVLVDAVDRVREQIRESFGPRRELRMVVKDGPDVERMAKELLEAMEDPKAAIPQIITGDPETLAAIRHVQFETREERLKREIADRLWELCGGSGGAEVTADGSADNDLAGERAEAIMKIIDVVKASNWPKGYVPLEPDASPEKRLQVIRQHLIKLCKDQGPGEPGEFKRASERADVVLAVASLARTHPDPKRLLPRGDRLGDWLAPGTPVVVHLGGFEHPAVVEPTRDTVTVRLTKANVVTEYPRDLISKEGEPWTPPKHTVD